MMSNISRVLITLSILAFAALLSPPLALQAADAPAVHYGAGAMRAANPVVPSNPPIPLSTETDARQPEAAPETGEPEKRAAEPPIPTGGVDAEPEGERPVFYRPLRTAPTYRHPPGFGSVPRHASGATVPTPLKKPEPPGMIAYPPGFGPKRPFGFEDVTPLDELDAIGHRLFSIATDDQDGARESLRQMALRHDPALIPPLVHAMQFSSLPQYEIARALASLANENAGDTWFEWAQWLESHPELVLGPELARAVVSTWRWADGKYANILPPEQTTAVPKASIYWDGSRVDGRPAVNLPRSVPPNEGFEVKPDDLVLGVSVNGAYRAYPVPQLLTTPIVNDVLGGHAISVVYEPLCGLPVAIDRGAAESPGISDLYSAGLVYRSSRLVYSASDRRLWDTCAGYAVSGGRTRLPLATATVTNWSAWRSGNPLTTVMDTAQAPRAANEVIDYYDRYIKADTLVYPAWLDDNRLKARERMLLIGLDNEDHAVRLGDLKGKTVINHRFRDQTVVIVVENPNTCTIRVYRRPENEVFGPSEFVDRIYGSGGGIWKVTEEALISPVGERLERVDGRGLYWFTIDGLNPISPDKEQQTAVVPRQ